ncbi:MAG: tetratricopeptide repeat protein [Brumimicrobium sp.]
MIKCFSRWGVPFLLIFSVVVILFACSTEKNTFINRLYHGTTARYNGLFNANELVRIGLEDYRANYRENYHEILPIDLYPNEEDVQDFYPIVDTAIAKCEKVISKHSMPTASKPSQKKTEHANWVDQNWVMIGKANFIRRDYQKAFDNFEYIRKFYVDRPSTYTGELWMAKTQIEMGEITEAGRTLQKLEQRYLNAKEEEKESKSKSKSKIIRKKKSSKKDKDDKAPKLPKHFSFELAKTKARIALEKNNNEEAIKQLKIALKDARKREDKARLNFILGQLLQEKNDPKAREYYTQSIKKNAPFEMSFHAQINRAVVSDLDDDEMIEELADMAKEQKYMEFRDQIYYAMAKVELGRNDVPQAKHYLSRSVFYSLNDPRQKGVSYEKLGDISFEERNYVFAQKYYDSSAQVIPESYFNYETIKNKANNLAKLVDNIDLIAYEDSVQRIANMDEKSRDKFLKDVIKQLKKEEQERKEREARRAQEMRDLQASYDKANAGSGNKWYFSNQKAMNEGLEEFRRVWGQRENEDNWRYTNIPAGSTMEEEVEDTIPEDSLSAENESDEVAIEDLTPEMLLEDIPLTDSAMSASNERLLEALYSSGMIYKEQLNEKKMGADQFQRVVDHGVENKHNVLSAFQLYKIYEKSNASKANTSKTYILENYPDSDYAKYLSDPDYFIKKKERDALALKEYLRSVERYERGLFYPIIVKADDVIDNEPENVFRKEYYLLKAMAMGQINADKTSLIPVLEEAIKEYPETEVAERAQEMLDLINEGVPPFKPFDFTSTEMYSFSSKDKFFVLIYLKPEDSQNKSQQDISNFNREFFSRDRLNTSPQILNSSQSFIQVKEFESTKEAKEYLRDFKKTKKHLGEMRNNEIIFISPDNFKTLMKEKALEEYEKFFQDNY